MRPITIIFIVVGLLIAGLAALLAKRAVNRPPPPSQVSEAIQNQSATSLILVAGKDLPAGTVLKDSDVRWQSWPNEAVDRRYIVKLGASEEARSAFIGAVVRQAFLSGEPMMANRVFRQEGAGMMAGILSPGMRAIGLQVSPQASAGGFILPGDRVDLIMTAQISQNDGEDPAKKAQSETVARNLRVLAVDQKLDDVQGAAQIYKTVTLEVSPKDAEAILQAEKTGEISLSLRSLTPGPTDDMEEIPVPEEKPLPRRVANDHFAGQVKVYRGASSTLESGR